MQNTVLRFKFFFGSFFFEEKGTKMEQGERYAEKNTYAPMPWMPGDEAQA